VKNIILGAILAVGLLATPALAQSSAGTWSDLPDRFQIDAGYFNISAATKLRFDGTTDIDFERDLGLDQHAATFWVDGTWRVGRRHQLKLGFTQFSRDRQGYTLTRDFTWGGVDYNTGLTATPTTSSKIVAGYYRFAIVRNDRFEIGPAVGIGYLKISAGIKATGTVTGPGGPTSRTLDESASTGSMTGALGGYASAWPTKRLVLLGDFLYIKVSPGDSTASVTDWRLGADYYLFKNAGIGVQYKYDRYRYDRGILATTLGGEVTYKGGQVFLTFRF
jgi:predicted porin